jgi:hypothetical protein
VYQIGRLILILIYNPYLMSDSDKDELLYEILNDRYLIEWQRTQSIENKATCIIGFIGLLLVFVVDLGLNHVNEIMRDFCMLIFYIICIGSLLFTLYVAMKALFFGNNDMWVIDNLHIMRNYVSRNQPYLQTVIDGFNDGISYNNELNAVKNTSLKKSILLFILSSALLLLFAFCYSHANAKQPDVITNISNTLSDISINANIQSHLPKNNSRLSGIHNNSFEYRAVYSRYDNNSTS